MSSVLDPVREAVEAVARVDVGGLSRTELAETVVGLRGLIERFEGEFARLDALADAVRCGTIGTDTAKEIAAAVDDTGFDEIAAELIGESPGRPHATPNAPWTPGARPTTPLPPPNADAVHSNAGVSPCARSATASNASTPSCRHRPHATSVWP